MTATVSLTENKLLMPRSEAMLETSIATNSNDYCGSLHSAFKGLSLEEAGAWRFYNCR